MMSPEDIPESRINSRETYQHGKSIEVNVESLPSYIQFSAKSCLQCFCLCQFKADMK